MLGKFFQWLHNIKLRYAGRINFARIPLISILRKQIIFLTRRKIVHDVNGYTMHVDDIDSLALSWHHVFEPGTTAFFKNNIHSGQKVIDIGANIGYYTLLFSGLVGEEGHVYAFEPEAESIKLLKKNLEINSIKNVTIIEKAVSNEDTTLPLYLSKINRGNHQIFNSGEGRESIDVKSTTIDSYFENSKDEIDWIKMDIEGAEYNALHGMKKLFKQNPSLKLITEMNASGLKEAGTSVEKYVNALKDLKFTFEEIDERTHKTKSMSGEELIQSFSNGRRGHPNVVCSRD
jgi:FkbM family methyltransferase